MYRHTICIYIRYYFFTTFFLIKETYTIKKFDKLFKNTFESKYKRFLDVQEKMIDHFDSNIRNIVNGYDFDENTQSRRWKLYQDIFRELQVGLTAAGYHPLRKQLDEFLFSRKSSFGLEFTTAANNEVVKLRISRSDLLKIGYRSWGSNGRVPFSYSEYISVRKQYREALIDSMVKGIVKYMREDIIRKYSNGKALFVPLIYSGDDLGYQVFFRLYKADAYKYIPAKGYFELAVSNKDSTDDLLDAIARLMLADVCVFAVMEWEDVEKNYSGTQSEKLQKFLESKLNAKKISRTSGGIFEKALFFGDRKGITPNCQLFLKK